MVKFSHICKMIVARRFKNAGIPIKEIARQAGVSVKTISRWLKVTKGYRL